MKRKSDPPSKSAKHLSANAARTAKHLAAGVEPPPSAEVVFPPQPLRLIDKAEVMRRVPFTYPSIWKRMREGSFPRARNTGGKTCWLESDINDWIAGRPVQPLKGDRKVEA